jgi:hypothetical protein
MTRDGIESRPGPQKEEEPPDEAAAPQSWRLCK